MCIFFGYSSTVSITQEEKKRQKLLEIFVVVDFFGQKLWVEKNTVNLKFRFYYFMNGDCRKAKKVFVVFLRRNNICFACNVFFMPSHSLIS